MAAVTNREEFKAYILRALGAPLINIDVATEQLEDRVDEAISYLQMYYWDGVKQEFFKHQITEQDMLNKYITVQPHILSITRVFNGSNSTNGQPNIFDLEYQLRMNDLRDLTSTSIVYYEQVMQHISLLQNRLNADRQHRFNYLDGKLFLDLNWDVKLSVGAWVVADAYAALDPSQSPRMWGDRLFKEYAIALTKMQWAQNLQKYQGIQLPGGVTLDAQQMYTSAQEDIDKVEQQIMDGLAPLQFFIG